jgi:hypothetical protein
MKLLAYSDLQATEGHERCFTNRALSLQQWRVRRAYAEMLRVYQEEQCDGLLDLGDTTDDRTALPIPTIDAVAEGLEQFPPSDWRIKLIGNHEQYLRSTTVHVGRLFKSHFRYVLDEPMVLDCGSFVMVCAPFPQEDGILAHWLEAVLEDHQGRKKLLLGHFQVVGCQMNSGQSLYGVPMELMREFDLGLLGHIHKTQTLVPPGNGLQGVYYIGSPFQQDFGESNEDKRVAIVDTDTLTVKWVPLTGFPVYRTVDFAEWVQTVRADSEDRFKVILRNAQETERYYAHPLCGRFEPIYDYQAPAGALVPVTASNTSVQSWMRTREGVLGRYMQMCPPGPRAISLSADELLQYGMQIADAVD